MEKKVNYIPAYLRLAHFDKRKSVFIAGSVQMIWNN